MKKYIFGIIILVMLITACASKPAASTGITIDQAIKEAATLIDELIPAGSKIAPLNFNSPHDRFSSYVLDELSANLVESRKLIVVDRKEIDLIRNEFDFQFSGEVGDDSMQELGRMLGAQSIVSGSLTDIGGDYRIMIRVLNVQNASVEVQYRKDIANDRRVQALLEGGKSGGVAAVSQRVSGGGRSAAQGSATQGANGNATASASTTTAIEVTAKSGGKLYFQDKEVATLWDNDTHTIPVEGQGTYALKMVFSDHTETRTVTITSRGITKISFGGVYAVGAAGPAGGIIFYDKGSYSDGWRFLEAAPASTEFTAAWGAYEKNVSGTSTAWGYGKANTQKIVEALGRFEETGRAAQLCANLNYGGYKDWFFPSKDELDLMYKNLKQKGQGGLQDERYWSSSESDNSTAWVQRFGDGRQENDYDARKNLTRRVRAIRQF